MLNKIYVLMKHVIKLIYFLIVSPALIPSYLRYRSTDEKEKYTHLLECINYARIALAPQGRNINFLEFGCHSGRTFSAAINASRYLKIKTEFWAFDSFEGLPPTDGSDGFFEAGTFCTSLTKFKSLVNMYTLGMPADINIVKGFFDKTLTQELASKIRSVAVVHIDVDLYSSTLTILNFLKPLLAIGTVIVFDDWYCFPPNTSSGESGALQEFCKMNPGLDYVTWKNYSTFGKSIIITKIPC